MKFIIISITHPNLKEAKKVVEVGFGSKASKW